MPLYVSTANPPASLDAASALDAIAAWGCSHALVVPGRMPGPHFQAEGERWDGRLALTHGCLEAPGEPWNLADRDEALRKRSVSRTMETLRLAASLGCPFVALEPAHALDGGRPIAGRQPRPGADETKALDQLCRSLDVLASQADTLGLALYMKNGALGAALWQQPEGIERTLDRLGAPPIGLLLDVGHALIASHARRYEPEPVVEAMAPFARAVAVSRNDGRQPLRLAPVENGVELTLARLAGGARLPVLIDTAGLDRPRLEEAVGLLEEALKAEAPPA
ncbi:MAG: sugar phosphate isomerase/epimerase family protein [Candidatus Sericytochromatia bacterium]